MEINGFKFYVRNHDSANKYYEAIRGDVILKSKNLNYLKKMVKNYS